MGSVIPLKKEVDNSYLELVNLVGNKLNDVNQQIKYKLASEVNLIHKMTSYHLKSGGKKIRPLLTLSSAKLCGYENGNRDVNLATCVELIHNATLLHDDVIDNSNLRRGIKTSNTIWGNQSSILVGDYLLSRCFEMMVEDGSQEILKLLSSTSSKIAQGEVLQLENKSEIDILSNKIYSIAGRKFNLNSPKQLAEILFDDLELKQIKKRSKSCWRLCASDRCRELVSGDSAWN